MSLGNVLIIGDSYSTFQGYIPEGYEAYYSEDENGKTDVRRVEETWWHLLMKEMDSHLILNDSWSGSTIGYTGYDGADCSHTSSFIYRLSKLKKAGFFEKNKIDTVFVFGGTNDHWCEAPLGTMMYDGWQKQDLYCVLPAVCYFFQLLKNTFTNVDIFCLINSDLKNEISEGLLLAGERNGIRCAQLQNIDKKDGHPTVKGMKQIEEQVREVALKSQPVI